MKISISDLTDGKPVKYEIDGESICVAKIGNEVFAIGDTCTHSDASLSEGEVVDGRIECWLHGAQFDLRTGEAVTPPAVEAVPTFKVSYEGDFVLINKGENNE